MEKTVEGKSKIKIKNPNPLIKGNKFNIKNNKNSEMKLNKQNMDSENSKNSENNKYMDGYNDDFKKYTQKNEYNDRGDEDEDEDLDDTVIKYIKHLSANILEFSLKYYNKYGKNILDFDKITKDNQTMIGSGILFIIISLGLYFIDITL